MDLVRAQVIAPLRDGGLPAGVKLRLSGAADQLTITWNHIVLDLLIAVAIVFLVMAVLFESFVYPLVIMISVPLATAGGVLGLAVLNLFAFQPLDMLTLLGFIILVGIVVNNAILLVHQTLFHIREGGMAPPDAIREATRDRLQPDLHVHAHQHIRHGAAGAVSGRGARSSTGGWARWCWAGCRFRRC